MKAALGEGQSPTGGNRDGVRDMRVVIDELNPTLRGWGGFFRFGNDSQ